MLEAVLPGTLRTTAMPVTVTCDDGPTRGGPTRGTTVADRRRGAEGTPVAVTLDADVDTVMAEILRRLTRLG